MASRLASLWNRGLGYSENMAYGFGSLARPTLLFFKQLRRMCCLTCFKYKWLDILVLDKKCWGPGHLTAILWSDSTVGPKRATRELITHRFCLPWVVGMRWEGRVPSMGPMSPICTLPHWVQCTQCSWHSQITFWFIPSLILSVILSFQRVMNKMLWS